MSDLTPETIAHLRELDAARTQGAWHHVGNSIAYESGRCTCYGGTLPHGHEPMCGLDQIGDAAGPNAEFIAAAANHMSALLDAVEERDEWKAAASAVSSDYSEAESRVDRIANERDVARAELAEAQARIERVLADCDAAIARESVLGEQVVTVRWLHAALAPATQREEGE